MYEKFERSEKILSLHQKFDASERKQFMAGILANRKKYMRSKKTLDLHQHAINCGFSVLMPETVEKCWAFYNTCDLHIGSRLHAHLYFLSQAARSFLTHVDERASGFSESLGFPVCDFRNLERYMQYDFEIYRNNNIRIYRSMHNFISYLKEEIL